MATKKEIKQRQNAIERIRKITYAMQIIAETRLARMKKRVLEARDYHKGIGQILSSIVARTTEVYHPLLERKEPARESGLVIINSDRGLCGGFNNNVFVQIEDFMLKNSDKNFKFIALGRKSEKFLRGFSENSIIRRFFDIEKKEPHEISKELSKDIIDLYLSNGADEIYIVYNEYRLHLLGRATRLKILPVEPEPQPETKGALTPPEKATGLPSARSDKESSLTGLTDYLYEPSVQEVLSAILPEYIYEQVYHAILESRFSEEMTRMVSMKMATDNADEIIEDLQLSYHKARQALITKELTEIINAI